MHHFLEEVYTQDCGHDHADLGAKEDLTKAIQAVKDSFVSATAWIHGNKGFTAANLTQPAIKKLIASTFKVLNKAVEKSIGSEVPAVMKEALQKNTFYFSGMKTFAQMTEVSGMLLEEDGKIKGLQKFQSDVKQLNEAYNENYLRSERNFAVGSSQQAAKWQKYDKQKDRYDLKYMTDNGPNVRESHRALEGIVLPVDDPFWDSFLPPNGYNCHCFADQIRKGEEEVSDPEEAMTRGNAATSQIGKDGENKASIFRFNPGKEMKVFPPKHPYTSGNCGNLAAVWHQLDAGQKILLSDAAEKCKAKKVVNNLIKETFAK